jgi:hypothetical protein
MANVAKINGYDVKDAEARGDIADIQQALSTAQGDITTLQGDVSDTKADLGDITALTTTVKTSAVNAINEVDSHADTNTANIGNLAELNMVDKTNIVHAINEVERNASYGISKNTYNFAPAFSDETSYAVGDYVTYNGVLYRCTTAHTAGVWVAGHFGATNVVNNLYEVYEKQGINVIPPEGNAFIVFIKNRAQSNSSIGVVIITRNASATTGEIFTISELLNVGITVSINPNNRNELTSDTITTYPTLINWVFIPIGTLLI